MKPARRWIVVASFLASLGGPGALRAEVVVEPALLEATAAAREKFARQRIDLPVLGALEDYRIRVEAIPGFASRPDRSTVGTSRVLYLLRPARSETSRSPEGDRVFRTVPEGFDLSDLYWREQDGGHRPLRLPLFAPHREPLGAIGGGERSFQALTTHLLSRDLAESSVHDALTNGHAYVAEDWLCDATGFAFGAVNNLGVFPMGHDAPMQGSTRLMSLTPLPAHHKLIHGGKVVATSHGTNLTFKAREPGAYRLEAWLEVAGEMRPWIYSNPVYLKKTSPLDFPLPDTVEPKSVEARRDLVYTAGRPEDKAKHQLDLYRPREGSMLPVFLFLHGGAWRFGDRRLYPPLGNRMAKEGILTVIPSYRLAPGSPWPAQIEDTAAAFAWTVRHVADHGGDTNRIFVGGHSAGGHLTSLLVFNRRFLEPHGLSPALIRGVISLSGVYDFESNDAMTGVFGTVPATRRDASPQAYVQAPAPPFFVSYCEWDYPMLPAQAKGFHRHLEQASISSHLHFTPRDNHIYEMLSFTWDTDPTSQAVVRFIHEN